MAAADVAYIESKLGVHPGWPVPHVNFLDIFPILADPLAFEVSPNEPCAPAPRTVRLTLLSVGR